MAAPTGHVTVVIVVAVVPEPHTVVTGPAGERVTDGEAGSLRDTDGEAGSLRDTVWLRDDDGDATLADTDGVASEDGTPPDG